MAQNSPEELTIGQLARRAGRRASTIRYYESVGVLPEPERVGGRRRYAADALRRLAVIDTGQRAGLSLREITELLGSSPQEPAAIERLREIAERKLPELEALIERTELVKGWLQQAAACECPSLEDCPLFDHAQRPPPAANNPRETSPELRSGRLEGSE